MLPNTSLFYVPDPPFPLSISSVHKLCWQMLSSSTYLFQSETWDSSFEFLSLNSYIRSITSTHWFYGLNISYICPLLRNLITIKTITFTSRLSCQPPNWYHYIQFFYISVPDTGSYLSGPGKMIHWSMRGKQSNSYLHWFVYIKPIGKTFTHF